MTYEQMKNALETMIDERGLTYVVDTIVEICYEKAEHIAANYQDVPLAKQWRDAGKSMVNPTVPTEFPT